MCEHNDNNIITRILHCNSVIITIGGYMRERMCYIRTACLGTVNLNREHKV